MINFCTTTANTEYGSITLHEREGAQPISFPERSEHSATLDGGAVISNYGISYADITFNFDVEWPGDDVVEKIFSMRDTGELIGMSHRLGFSIGTMKNITDENGLLKILFVTQGRF